MLEKNSDYVNPFFIATFSKEADKDSNIMPVEPQKQERNRDGKALTMAYVPMQKMCEMYDDEKALEEGTIFSCLNKPFYGREGLDL